MEHVLNQLSAQHTGKLCGWLQIIDGQPDSAHPGCVPKQTITRLDATIVISLLSFCCSDTGQAYSCFSAVFPGLKFSWIPPDPRSSTSILQSSTSVWSSFTKYEIQQLVIEIWHHLLEICQLMYCMIIFMVVYPDRTDSNLDETFIHSFSHSYFYMPTRVVLFRDSR